MVILSSFINFRQKIKYFKFKKKFKMLIGGSMKNFQKFSIFHNHLFKCYATSKLNDFWPSYELLEPEDHYELGYP